MLLGKAGFILTRIGELKLPVVFLCDFDGVPNEKFQNLTPELTLVQILAAFRCPSDMPAQGAVGGFWLWNYPISLFAGLGDAPLVSEHADEGETQQLATLAIFKEKYHPCNHANLFWPMAQKVCRKQECTTPLS